MPPGAFVRATTWNGPTGQSVIVPACVSISSTLPTRKAAPLLGLSAPRKSSSTTARTDTVCEVGAWVVLVVSPGGTAAGRSTCTSTGWNERLGWGILITPVLLTDAMPDPTVDIPSTEKVGVRNERLIDTWRLPGLPTLAPAPGARSGATMATVSATTATIASRRVFGPRPRKTTPSLPTRICRSGNAPVRAPFDTFGRVPEQGLSSTLTEV